MEHFKPFKTLLLASERRAREFAANKDGKRRHVELRIDDQIYVYLYEDDVHVQTQNVGIPDRWEGGLPSDETIKRYVRRHSEIGSVPIVEIDVW